MVCTHFLPLAKATIQQLILRYCQKIPKTVDYYIQVMARSVGLHLNGILRTPINSRNSYRNGVKNTSKSNRTTFDNFSVRYFKCLSATDQTLLRDITIVLHGMKCREDGMDIMMAGKNHFIA